MGRNIWRYTWNTPKLWKLDYRVTLFILIWLFHPRLWTFLLAIFIITIFFIIEIYKRINIITAFRMMKIGFSGWLFGNCLFPSKLKYRRYFTAFPEKSIVQEFNDNYRKQLEDENKK